MSYSERDSKSVWHPYTQMKTAGLPFAITKAKGAILTDENGNDFIDAISSWWTTLHGHCQPEIIQAVTEQIKQLDHVIFAGFTHPAAVILAEKLKQHLPGHPDRIFFSDNGSTSIEVAIKMTLQYWFNSGKPRNKIIAFENAYHGDTFGSMSVSARSVWTDPFSKHLFEVIHIPVPVLGSEEIAFETLVATIESNSDEIAAFIFEPLIQGSAGMIMYEASELDKMIAFCQGNNILCISDEVMTGFYRTGKLFAGDYLKSKPDIHCLSKGLTGGILPLGITSCKEEIFQAFWSDDKNKSFFHGHSFTGNPIASAAAVASLDLLLKEETLQKIRFIEKSHQEFRDEMLNNKLVSLCNVKGTILVLEIATQQGYSYFSPLRDKLYNYFLSEKVLLRPLGNRIYILPPYGITKEQLNRTYSVIRNAIQMFSPFSEKLMITENES